MKWSNVRRRWRRLSHDTRWPKPRSRLRLCVYLSLAVLCVMLSYQLIVNHGPSALASFRAKLQSLLLASMDLLSEEPMVLPADKELVLAAMRSSNMSWVQQKLPDWRANIYRGDAHRTEATLTVPMNKGNEAMVYLTYLIDRYWSLPGVAVFLHGGRYQWHNDNPLYDSVISLTDLNLDFVREVGFVNLRCAWLVGCPRELKPARYLRERPEDPLHPAAVEYPHAFMELFARTEVPEVVGTPCCSQFAVSRGKILERSREEYVRLRKWLMQTTLHTDVSGRILEYSWHMIFGNPAQYCPDTRMCYCKTYGYCNMTDEELERQWVWRGVVLPEDWPAEASNLTAQ